MIRFIPVFLGISSTSPLRCARDRRTVPPEGRFRRAPLYPPRAPTRRGVASRCASIAIALLLAAAGHTLRAAEGTEQVAPGVDAAPGMASGSVNGSVNGSTGAPTNGPVSGSVTVAAASSLRAVWPRLEARWQQSLPGVRARPTFGASHTLARQIARGAPFELLLSADVESVAALSEDRADASSAATYAAGRLALVQRGDANAALPPTLARLAARLRDVPDARLAIPNPAHAPYGRAAREALASVGVWPLAAGRLVIGENAAQTLQFVLAGAVDAALVPWSLVAVELPPGTRAAPLPADVHGPLVHRLVVTADASPAARALGAWFLGDAARAVLVAGGFDAPPRPDVAR